MSRHRHSYRPPSAAHPRHYDSWTPLGVPRARPTNNQVVPRAASARPRRYVEAGYARTKASAKAREQLIGILLYFPARYIVFDATNGGEFHCHGSTCPYALMIGTLLEVISSKLLESHFQGVMHPRLLRAAL
eukprot:scaffold539654_cov32-Prasinocladus_malaysianus.AAC.1